LAKEGRQVRLHDVLASRRAEVIDRWKAEVQGTLAPESLAHIELVDHLPDFIREVMVALRARAGLTVEGAGIKETAAGHGAQRLRLGFSLESVVREYGAVRHAIWETARHAGAEVTLEDTQVLADSIISGIASAVSEYARQRDAELLRLANEHFAFIAHELRSPLTSATMTLGLLKKSGRLPENDRGVASLTRGLQRATDLIEHTLEVARVASGIDLRKEWTTLEELFRDAELAAEPEAETRGIKLVVRVERDRRLSVDVRLVQSALINLLRNGVKYTQPETTVELRGRVEDGRATIEIEDQCGGLPPGRVEEAFAPFVRLQGKQSGFGLGLAIAKQAVDARGGSIRVQNVPGKGCMFVLELPLT
jgi:signal transduction histidine kinase